jgi:hypothetical protein
VLRSVSGNQIQKFFDLLTFTLEECKKFYHFEEKIAVVAQNPTFEVEYISQFILIKGGMLK